MSETEQALHPVRRHAAWHVGPPRRKVIETFIGQYQAAENWCWAAVAASVFDSYRPAADVAREPTTQCSVADLILTGTEPACRLGREPRQCATRPGPDQSCDCLNVDSAGTGYKDRQGFLNVALKELGVLEKSVVLGSGKSFRIADPCKPATCIEIGDALDLDEIRTCIDLDRLVCLRIVRGGFRHFIVVYGYEGYPDNDLLIWDPAAGPDVVDFETLLQAYGPFTHKLLTRPPAPGAAGR